MAARGGLSAGKAKDKVGVAVSTRTVQRVLKRVGRLEYCKVEQTLPLSNQYKTTHLKKAKRVIDDGAVWSEGVFSDTKRFFSRRRRWVVSLLLGLSTAA